ncbi:MAG TPA: phage major capsid protein [Mycobacteriales bacterium]|jgi:HK97 family phage major capsid protein|nr:phage major capsid protein [Mycobacteriales bacterium]
MPESTQTAAAGGVLTREQVATLLLQPLQAASIFLAAGPRIFDTAGGNNLKIPKLTGSTGGAWVAEAGPIPDDDVTFGELNLLPTNMKSVKVITKVSDELLRQSTVALDAVLRARLVADVAATLDTAFIASTVTDGTQPLGLLNQPGVQTIAVGGAITFDVLYDMIGKLLTANVDATAARWMLTPFVFQALRKTKSTDGKYLMQPDVMEQGQFRLLGYPVTVTPRIPTTGSGAFPTKVVLWAPSLYAVARDIAPEVKVLDQTYAASGQIGIRVQARYDAGPLYPESVVIATGVNGG